MESDVLVYYVAWESGRGTRYASSSENGVELMENAIEFNTEKDAEDYIYKNCGDHCYVLSSEYR